MPPFTLRPSDDGKGLDVILSSGRPLKTLQSHEGDLSNVALALCHVAGTNHFGENTLRPSFDVGRTVLLVRAAFAGHEEAIAVRDETGELQAGWLPEWAARHSPGEVFPRRAIIVHAEPLDYGGPGRLLKILYGRDLDESWPKIPLVAATKTSCPDCGARLPKDAASCPLCGSIVR